MFDSALYTLSAAGISMLSSKALGESLGAPQTIKGVAKLAVAVGVGAMGVKYL